MTTKEGLEKYKSHILLWLPVMKEMELMGYNPVKFLFGGGALNMVDIENSYIAIQHAKIKYPEWYKVVSTAVDKCMLEWGNDSRFNSHF